MSIQTVQFFKYLQDGVPFESDEQCHAIFFKALNLANERLKNEGIVISFARQIPMKSEEGPYIDHSRNIVLKGKHDGKEFLMDIIDSKALNESTLKPEDNLAEEMVGKTKQHIAAMKTEGILISEMGWKIDTRNYDKVAIDAEGYLTIAEKRLLSLQPSGEYYVAKAGFFHSYSICRIVVTETESGTEVRLFDEYDLVRENEKGMYILLDKTMKVGASQLMQQCRAAAEGYKGEYLSIERDTPTKERKEELYQILVKLPYP
jgi:hypothetical protein